MAFLTAALFNHPYFFSPFIIVARRQLSGVIHIVMVTLAGEIQLADAKHLDRDKALFLQGPWQMEKKSMHTIFHTLSLASLKKLFISSSKRPA